MFRVTLTSSRAPVLTTGRFDRTVALFRIVFGTSVELYTVVGEPGVPTWSENGVAQEPSAEVTFRLRLMDVPQAAEFGTWKEKWFPVGELAPAARLGQLPAPSKITT